MSQKQEIDVAWRSIMRGVDGIIDAVAAVPESKRNEKPAEAANSLYVLAVHVMGSTEKNLLDVLGGERECYMEGRSLMSSSGREPCSCHD